MKGDDVRATDYARCGIALDPSSPFGYHRLADALISAGKPAEAIEALQKGMRLDPKGSSLLARRVGRTSRCENTMRRYGFSWWSLITAQRANAFRLNQCVENLESSILRPEQTTERIADCKL